MLQHKCGKWPCCHVQPSLGRNSFFGVFEDKVNKISKLFLGAYSGSMGIFCVIANSK